MGLKRIVSPVSHNWIQKHTYSTKFSDTVMKVLSNYKSTQFKNVCVLEKITKFDLEVQNGLSPEQVYNSFPLAYKTHITHKKIMESLIRHLIDVYKLDIQVIKAQTKGVLPFGVQGNKHRYRPDLVISAGGDGTFLEASSLIPPGQLTDTPIWLVGVNTDPERSLGNLCMSYHGPKLVNHLNCGFEESVNNQPTSNENCSETHTDKNMDDFCSFIYHRGDEKKLCLKSPNNITEEDRNSKEKKVITYDQYVNTLLDNLLNFRLHPIPRQRLRLKLFKRKFMRNDILETTLANKEDLDSNKIENTLLTENNSTFDERDLEKANNTDAKVYTFPHGVLNDVMIADKDFGKTFYAIVQIDDKPLKRIKSSGVLITTGTGSTAWAYNVSKMNFFEGTRLIKCLLEHPTVDNSLSEKINDEVIRESIERFNQKLKMDPSGTVMRCLIREPISNKTTECTSFYNCHRIKVVPLSKNSLVCIDGSKTLKLDYGDIVVLKNFESDLIWSFI
ncbi:NAD(+) kinase [Theileria orientalis]|uniref:NAD(+) kinase n=1 Tax=Theileria orientalis TaxID=68886 RepID=A0A976QUQ8_THEOR|nr:NAD(+) kinase [Theileria orientalis]